MAQLHKIKKSQNQIPGQNPLCTGLTWRSQNNWQPSVLVLTALGGTLIQEHYLATSIAALLTEIAQPHNYLVGFFTSSVVTTTSTLWGIFLLQLEFALLFFSVSACLFVYVGRTYLFNTVSKLCGHVKQFSDAGRDLKVYLYNCLGIDKKVTRSVAAYSVLATPNANKGIVHQSGFHDFARPGDSSLWRMVTTRGD